MLPTEVDCIVLGTGLTNSIIAAACSRIGLSVLHVDNKNFYGQEWASFTFSQLIDWIRCQYPNDDCLKIIPKELLDNSRMFLIDLTPRLLFCTGPMVELLTMSNVSRYHEFKNNVRILSRFTQDIQVLPCRRSDVFVSPLLSDLVDKRRLMKFIELCTKHDHEAGESKDEISKNADKPIKEFLVERGLNSTLQQIIIDSIAMVKPSDPTSLACKNVKNFIYATERYGKSPFLFPLYGCGEFPQSFCRLSAVFGGTYCLSTSTDEVKIKAKDEKDPKSPCKFSVRFSGKDIEVKSDHLVMDYNYASKLDINQQPNSSIQYARAILITKKSIIPNEDNNISFMRIPPSEEDGHPIFFLELNSSMFVCPPEFNIVYLWTRTEPSDSQFDLGPIIDQLYDGNANAIIWKFFFRHSAGMQNKTTSDNLNEHLHVTSPPSDDLDYEDCIKEAKEIFKALCPDQEFLPRAPDPGEIVI